MRLNLGSGWDNREGYVNVDLLPGHGPDVVADLLRLPFGAIASEILAQDVLEHLPRTRTRNALEEWRRVCQVGGALLVRVPSLFHAARLMRRGNDLHTHELLLQNLYGTQAYTGDVHLTSFTDITLASYLHDSGWRDVEGGLVDEWMWEVSARASVGKPVAVFWGLGIYPEERNEWASWRWLSACGELSLVCGATETVTATVAFEVAAGHSRGGLLTVRSAEDVIEVQSGEQVRFPVKLDPGQRCEISLEAGFDRVIADGDTRDLRCQLVNVRLDDAP